MASISRRSNLPNAIGRFLPPETTLQRPFLRLEVGLREKNGQIALNLGGNIA